VIPPFQIGRAASERKKQLSGRAVFLVGQRSLPPKDLAGAGSWGESQLNEVTWHTRRLRLTNFRYSIESCTDWGTLLLRHSQTIPSIRLVVTYWNTID